jgi:hypothetical protein
MIHIRTVTAAAALAAAASFAHANHVDFLDAGTSFSISSSDATAVSDTQTGPNASILGGTRVVTVARDGGFSGSITASKDAGDNFIEVFNGTTAAGTLTIDYPGISDADFQTMWDKIDVQIPALFQSTGIGDAEFDAFLTVESSAGSGTVATGRIEASVTGGSTVLSFPFDAPGFSNVDFFDVDGVTLVIETAIIGSDFQVGPITREVIPEPTSLALLGLSGLGLLRRRR